MYYTIHFKSLDMSSIENIQGFKHTYFVTIDGENNEYTSRTVWIVFIDENHAKLVANDYFDDCRTAIQSWLNNHFPGEILAETNGDDIEFAGDDCVADNEDFIDMRFEINQ